MSEKLKKELVKIYSFFFTTTKYTTKPIITITAITIRKRKMELEENGNPRLGVDDKRHLFMVLVAKVERLFNLNKFPVDQLDFALSLQGPEVEKAWRLLVDQVGTVPLAPTHSIHVPIGKPSECLEFLLSSYVDTYIDFMNVDYDPMRPDNRFLYQVREWANRQVTLEDQVLRTIKVIKCIVRACNTVGQYKRVSPELLGFLPSKYGQALGEYTKKSPYPAMETDEADIEAAMSCLAFASLQPMHKDGELFRSRDRSRWSRPHYALTEFPRTKGYSSNHYRTLNL